MMRLCLVIGIAFQFVVAAALAQPATPKFDLLSMDQQVKIGEIIAEKTTSLRNVQFSPIVDAAVPAQITIQELPSDAKKLVPQLDGYGCVVFEEPIAIVDMNTRKVATVIPRWHRQ